LGLVLGHVTRTLC